MEKGQKADLEGHRFDSVKLGNGDLAHIDISPEERLNLYPMKSTMFLSKDTIAHDCRASVMPPPTLPKN